MMTKIILDTNFLLIPGQFGVDIFAEIDRICNFAYELAVVPETIIELKQIIGGSGSLKDRKAASLALQLLERYRVKTLANYRKVFKRADEAILAIADRSSVVATQDRELRKLLRKNAVRLIILRQKKYLMLLGE